MFANVPGGSMLNNIGGNITSLGDKVNPTGALGNLGSKLPGNLNPTNIAGTFTGAAGNSQVHVTLSLLSHVLDILFCSVYYWLVPAVTLRWIRPHGALHLHFSHCCLLLIVIHLDYYTFI